MRVRRQKREGRLDPYLWHITAKYRGERLSLAEAEARLEESIRKLNARNWRNVQSRRTKNG